MTEASRNATSRRERIQRVRDFMKVLRNCAFDRAEIPDEHYLATTGAATALYTNDVAELLDVIDVAQELLNQAKARGELMEVPTFVVSAVQATTEQIGWLCHHADGGRHFIWKSEGVETDAEERAWIEKRYVRYEPAYAGPARGHGNPKVADAATRETGSAPASTVASPKPRIEVKNTPEYWLMHDHKNGQLFWQRKYPRRNTDTPLSEYEQQIILLCESWPTQQSSIEATRSAQSSDGRCPTCNTAIAQPDSSAEWALRQCAFESCVLDLADECEAMRRGVGVVHANGDPLSEIRREIGSREHLAERERLCRTAMVASKPDSADGQSGKGEAK